MHLTDSYPRHAYERAAERKTDEGQERGAHMDTRRGEKYTGGEKLKYREVKRYTGGAGREKPERIEM